MVYCALIELSDEPGRVPEDPGRESEYPFRDGSLPIMAELGGGCTVPGYALAATSPGVGGSLRPLCTLHELRSLVRYWRLKHVRL